MTLIGQEDRDTIRRLFDERLTGDVQMTMFTERTSAIIIPGKLQCETCDQTQELLEEVASLSDKISLTVHELDKAREQAAEHGIDRVPAFVATGAAKGRVRFFGIPSGYEFSAFIEDLIDVSRGGTDLSEETRSFLASLTEEVNIKVFTTPT
jgi:alkyl hydroperoxide reductase subunit AhpF